MTEELFQPELSVRAKLLQEMRSGAYARALRLPSENDLSRSMGISRTCLRDALASLEREGFISRLQGVGTIINHHVLDLPFRMDMEVEFMDMVAASGFRPGVGFIRSEQLAADEVTAQRLHIEPGAPVLLVERLVTADGDPVIYCQDYISRHLIKQDDYRPEVLQQPIFLFLREYCQCEPAMDITEVRAVAADERLARLLRVKSGDPLLFMDEVDFDLEGQPILYAAQYYARNCLPQRVLRKKL